jgi:TonB family protein
MKPTLRHGVLLLAITGAAVAAPPYRTPNEKANAGPPPPAAQRSAEESNRASKLEVFVARAEISVDAQGRPQKVTLLNPTADAWINRHAVQEIRRRRFSPPAGGERRAGETFTCTVRIEVQS